MSTSVPKAQLILDYKIYFGIEPSEDRITLIGHICKKNILAEIVALNYRLKPKGRIYFDNSFKTQVNELKYFTKTEDLFIKYSRVAEKFTRNEIDFPNIFNRQACLYAIEEITNSDQIHFIDGFVLEKGEDWEAILKYLLAVNYIVTQIKEEKDDNETSFESLNPKLIPLNELSGETIPIFTLYRGYSLIKYFLNKTPFSSEVKDYIISKYGIEPEEFIFQIMRIYLANNPEGQEFDFYYRIEEGETLLFDRLSERISNKETYKLIGIRKSPFICIGKNEYILADNSFLLEKIYSQFLNDFWFDRIKNTRDYKGNFKYRIDSYRSQFGYFFESYLSQILINVSCVV